MTVKITIEEIVKRVHELVRLSNNISIASNYGCEEEAVEESNIAFKQFESYLRAGGLK